MSTRKTFNIFLLLGLTLSVCFLPFVQGQIEIGEDTEWAWNAEFGDFLGYHVTTSMKYLPGLTHEVITTQNVLGFQITSDNAIEDVIGSLQLQMIEHDFDLDDFVEINFLLEYHLNQTQEDDYYLIHSDPFTNHKINEENNWYMQNIIYEIPFFLMLPINITEGLSNASYWYEEGRTEVFNYSRPIDYSDPSTVMNYSEAYNMTQDSFHKYNDNSLRYTLNTNDIKYEIIMQYDPVTGILKYGSFEYIYYAGGGNFPFYFITEWEHTDDISDLIGISNSDFSFEDDLYYVHKTNNQLENIFMFDQSFAKIKPNKSIGEHFSFTSFLNAYYEINSTIKFWNQDHFNWSYLYPWEQSGSILSYLNDYNLLTDRYFEDISDSLIAPFSERNLERQVGNIAPKEGHSSIKVFIHGIEDTFYDLNGTVLRMRATDESFVITDITDEGFVEQGGAVFHLDGTFENDYEEGDRFHILPHDYLMKDELILPSIYHPMSSSREYLSKVYSRFYTYHGNQFGLDLQLNLETESGVFLFEVYDDGLKTENYLQFEINEHGILEEYILYMDEETTSFTRVSSNEKFEVLFDFYDIELSVSIGDMFFYNITECSIPEFDETYIAFIIEGYGIKTLNAPTPSRVFTIDATFYNLTWSENKEYYVWEKTEPFFKWGYDGVNFAPIYEEKYNIDIGVFNTTDSPFMPYFDDIPDTYASFIYPSFIQSGSDLENDALSEFKDLYDMDYGTYTQDGYHFYNFNKTRYIEIEFDNQNILANYSLSISRILGEMHEFSFNMKRVDLEEIPTILPFSLDIENLSINQRGGYNAIEWNFTSIVEIQSSEINAQYLEIRSEQLDFQENSHIAQYIQDDTKYSLRSLYLTKSDDIFQVTLMNEQFMRGTVSIPITVDRLTNYNRIKGLNDQSLTAYSPLPSTFGIDDYSTDIFNDLYDYHGTYFSYSFNDFLLEEKSLIRYYTDGDFLDETSINPNLYILELNARKEKYNVTTQEWDVLEDVCFGLYDQYFSLPLYTPDTLHSLPFVFVEGVTLFDLRDQLEIGFWIQNLNFTIDVSSYYNTLDLVLFEHSENPLKNITLMVEFYEDVSFVKSFEFMDNRTGSLETHFQYQHNEIVLSETETNFELNNNETLTTVLIEKNVSIYNLEEGGVYSFTLIPVNTDPIVFENPGHEIIPMISDDGLIEIQFEMNFSKDNFESLDYSTYVQFRNSFDVYYGVLISDGTGQYQLYEGQINIPIARRFIEEPTSIIAMVIIYLLIGGGIAGAAYGIHYLVTQQGDTLSPEDKALKRFCKANPNHEKCI